MEEFIEKYQRLLGGLKLTFVRSGLDFLKTEHRLLGIRGARGTGKTTLLLQYARSQPSFQTEVLYVSLDNFWFANNTLYGLAETFVKKGGRTLLVDEVHKYPRWAQELKNVYDDFAELRVIFTGSSLLEILNSRADLSRRAVVFSLQGLSFREYLALDSGIELPPVSLDDIIKHHADIVPTILEKVKPFAHFDNYLHHGYYPFFKESELLYFTKLENVVNLILEIELPQLRQLDVAYIAKIRQVLAILAESTPFTPNMTKLSERIGINRTTLLQYVHFLQEAGLLINLYKKGEGLSQLQKPNKLFLDNTNLAFMFSPRFDKGALRETFFANQVGFQHMLNFPTQGDFLVDERYTFEVGGKNKNRKQLGSTPKAFLALDDIEYGSGSTIPLWLFGFLY
jgi:predicted AAA+ superfamily ATPase